MSRNIDERVVSMQFDNRQFERNVQTSMSTLDKLKQSLNFNGAAKGFEDISASANRVNFSGLSNAIETINYKFSAMGVMVDQTLRNMANSAYNAGKRIISALTIDPIKTGFQEYETQINAVQTILANTQSKGTTLTDVNRALDELNTYADKTIYNFTEMTRNIGTFTAAGIDLDTATNAIQGIANLAAVSGSTSQQASTAMYQLSQALSSGTVKLMDWNSVVNAGMGGQVFQDALKETARVHGINIDAMIKKQGSFRETLQEGWLSADILTETLQKFTMTTEGLTDAQIEANREMLKAKGYTDSQIDEIFKLGDTATQAATKVKTLTQLWDTLKEAAQSGWTQSWEIMVGDFEEAKELYTSISDSVGNMLNNSAEARNKVLSEGLSSGWKQFLNLGVGDEQGFKDTFIELAKERGMDIDKIIKESGSFEKAITKDGVLDFEGYDMLGDTVSKFAEKLNNMSDAELKAAGYTKQTVAEINALDKAIKNGSISTEEFAEKIKRLSGRQNIIKGFTNIFKSIIDLVKPINEAFKEIFPPITGDQLYNLTVKFKEFTERLKVTDEVASKVKRAFKGIFSIFDMFKKVIVAVLKPVGQLLGSEGVGSLASLLLDTAASVGDFFTALNEGFDMTDISGSFSKIVTVISDVLKGATEGIRGFGNILSKVGETILNVAGKIWDAIKTVFGFISDNVSAKDIFAGLAGGGIFVLAKKLIGLVDNVKDALDGGGLLSLIFGGKKGDDDGPGIADNFKEILGSVNETLQSFTTGIKVTSIVAISVAIGILSASLRKLSEINVPNLTKSLAAIGILLTMLSKTLSSMTTTLGKNGSKGIFKSAAALILVAKAVDVLASAVEKISKLSLPDLAKGLIGVGAGMVILAKGLTSISGSKISLSTSIAMLALAESCKILADALKSFAEMQWDEIGRGLSAMGGALAELVASISILNKFGGGKSIFGSIGIFIVVQSLQKLSDALKSFAEMKWDQIGRGLAAMGGALGEVTIAVSAAGKIAGFSGIFGGAAIDIVILGLSKLAKALKSFSSMSWDEIGRGLSAMGGALGEVTVAVTATGKIAGFSGILGGAAIDIVILGLGKLADALKTFGSMSWEEIARGLVAMGGALLEIAGISGTLGKIAGLSGILGGAAIDVVILGLGKLADVFVKFGSMSWEEIGRGLTGMGGALLEVGGITGGLGYLTNIAGILGGASIWVAVQGLEDLANALKSFGSMSWDEIKQGLAAMGGALGELALGGFLNTLSIIGSYSISEVAKPLGDLADSVRKWQGVEVPQNLGINLGYLAQGVAAFTLGGFGADAIATLAKPLGDLASSVMRWSKVTIPEGLTENLRSLGSAIMAFNFSGFGASALEGAAKPLGDLADSVKKWSDVTVPENIESDLKKIANGIYAFSYTITGGLSIRSLITPLSELPDAISKWNGVTVPENIDTDLKKIANGVLSFSFAFMGGWSVQDISGPLKSLASSVKAWSDVTVPEKINTDLKSLSSGVKSFTLAFVGGWSLGEITGPLKDLASSVKAWNGVSVPENIGSSLKSVASGVKAFAGIGDISGATSGISSIVKSVKGLSGVNYGSINVGFANLATSIINLGNATKSISGAGNKIVNELVKPIQNASSKFKTVGSSIANSILNGFVSRSPMLISQTTVMLSKMFSILSSKVSMFRAIGSNLMSAFASGVFSKSAYVSYMLTASISPAIASANGYYSSFYSAGQYLADGFANGISANSYKAAARARAMAKAAKQAAEEALGIASPSKVFYKIGSYTAQGFVNALDDYSSNTYNAGSEMAESAKQGFSRALNKVKEIIDSGLDTQPTIRPVLDLSDVSSGAKSINDMFGMSPSLGVLSNVDSINSMMNQRIQNGVNNDIINAIDKLRKDIGNVGGTTYNIEGITYDDGSNISDAVKALIRAAKMERRM